MKRLLLVFEIIFFVSVLYGHTTKSNLGNGEFVADVYKVLLNNHPKSFVVSPISIQIILALVHFGAAGTTAKELASTLHISNDKEEVKESMKELANLLPDDNKYILRCAKKIYVGKQYKIREEFKNIAIDIFKSDIDSIDFDNKEKAAAEINQWVEKETQDKIKDFINKDELTQTASLLINAIYFQGKWLTAFERTSIQMFYPYPDKMQKTITMNVVARFNYADDQNLQAKFVELPYEGDNLTMTIVLPHTHKGLSNLEDNLSDVLSFRGYVKASVNLHMPKFNAEATINFEPILQDLGIKEAFEPTASITDILVDQNLVIDKVFQKTIIEVDEQGTTGSVVSGVVVKGRAMHPSIDDVIVPFYVDRPFVYFLKIKDRILFVGRYMGK